MSHPTPSYSFTTSGGQRQFFHRWHFANNVVTECNKCGTICKENDAYSQHWQQLKIKLSETGDELNTSLRTAIMEHQPAIVSDNIESFMFCDGKVASDLQQFILDAGKTAIPDLLKVLFATDGCKKLMVKVKFYVEIGDDMFMLESSELEIKHHSDISESVDMIFLMLLERWDKYMLSIRQRSVFRIKRILVQAQRIQYGNNEQLELPLKYKLKEAMLEKLNIVKENVCDVKQLTLAFQQHLNTGSKGHFKPPFPCNLYCFQTCPNSRELYAVPYHFSSTPATQLSTRSFIILNDILGNFQQLQEIKHTKEFLHPYVQEKILTCSECPETFMQPSRLSLHKMLNCGHNFELLQIDPDFSELHEEGLEIMRCPNWCLYCIIK